MGVFFTKIRISIFFTGDLLAEICAIIDMFK